MIAVRPYLSRGSAIFLMALGPAHARAAPAEDPPVYDLPEFVVRAWHFEESTLEVPADVRRIDRGAIERSLAASLPDLLAVEANLFFSDLAGSTNVAMRGFGEGSGLRSLILVDGQPLNPADMGRINWEQIPLDSIESVEVLQGGHNVLYGDKALAGVIKIETRQSAESRLDLEGRLGSFGREQAVLGGAFGGADWQVRGGLFRDVSEGYRENSASETRGGYGSAGRTFVNGDRLTVRLAAGESRFLFPGGLSQADLRTDPRSSGNLGDEGSDNRYGTLTSRFESERSWGRWELLAGYDRNETDWTFGAGSYGSNRQSGYSFKPRARIGGAPVTVILGGDLLYDRLDFEEYLTEARRIVSSEAELSETRLSPYAFAEYAVDERLALSAGLRHEWVRYAADNRAYDPGQLDPVIRTNRGEFPNPNFKSPPDLLPEASFSEVVREDGSAAEVSLNYRFAADWSAWIGYDRVYRYPVFDERASYQGFPLAETVSRDLEAETGDSFETGIKYAGGRHEFYATLFLLLMENEIIFDPDLELPDSIGRGLNVNLGPVRRLGADLAYFYDARDWGFSVQLAAVDTEMRSGRGRGRELPLVPKLRITNQLWWKPLPAIRLRGVHRYVGERFQGGDFTNTLDPVEAYHLVDLHAELELNPRTRLFLSATNALDKRYAESVFFGSYHPGEGRAFQAGMRLEF